MSVYIIAQLKFTRRELYGRYQSRFMDVFKKFKGKAAGGGRTSGSAGRRMAAR
jgi:uncharacterized protein (DUF1330 family)